MRGLLITAVVLLAGWLLFRKSQPASSSASGDAAGGKSSYDDLLQAIHDFEGAGVRDTNNNPGNLKGGSFGQLGTDARGFDIFADTGDGWDALQSSVSRQVAKNPTWDYYDLFNYRLNGRTDAPVVTAQGNSDSYAEYVANVLGVDPTTPVSLAVGG